ncbi:MAG TPA: hypothetical protein VN676_06815 [Steroidobacteraceae bacterium]|nr:hypothetical protein [Steroidobacteraceae bacterium]
MIVPVISALALWGAPVAAAESAGWFKNGIQISEKSEASSWKGHVTLKFVQGEPLIVVKCEDTVTGTVGPKGAAEMTKWTFSNCSSAGSLEQCRQPSLEAGSLPWHTTLAVVGTTIRNVLPSTSQMSIKCEGHTAEVCSRLPNEILKNKETSVGGEYNLSEDLLCTLSSTSHFEGQQEITLVSGGHLQVKTF